MPYNYAHAALALLALPACSDAAAAVVSRCPEAFCAGAMGPDPYFADAMPKPLFRREQTALASRMHALDARTLLFAFFSAAEAPAQRAYALGFACHFLLDVNAHPYIFARFPGSAHTPGEMRMDLPFTDTLDLPALKRRPCDFFRLGRDTLMQIDALHASVVGTLFHEESAGAFARSYRKWVGFINRLSYDPYGRTLRFTQKLEKRLLRPGLLSARLVTRDPLDPPRDLMNLSHTPWCAPWDESRVRTESFPELFRLALSETPALLDAAAAGFRSRNFADAVNRIGGRCMNGSFLLS